MSMLFSPDDRRGEFLPNFRTLMPKRRSYRCLASGEVANGS